MDNQTPQRLFSLEDGAMIKAAGKEYIKKQNPVFMVRIMHEFEVETDSGRVKGEAGDWLVYDPMSGHVWPIKDSYYRQHYEPR